MSTVEYAFSELVQHPNRVTDELASHRRVILRRRGAPDLALIRADQQDHDLAEVDGLGRLLAGLVRRTSPGDLVKAVEEGVPWTKYLSPAGVEEFAAELPAVVRDCIDLKTFAPLERFFAEWQNTAAIQADPELAERLTRPIDKPIGTPVPAP